MAHPGMKTDDLYLQVPYKEGWQPIESRTWALGFMSADGEDYAGFLIEFRRRHPHLWQNQVPAFLPASVDSYVRVDQNGERQDLDYELAAMPLTDEEKADQEQEFKAQIRARRLAALRSRGKKIPPSLAATETETSEPPKRGPGRPRKETAPAVSPDELLEA